MILSFHPCFIGDRNIICAGRDPGPEELAAIQSAKAVILPQGCRQSLFDMATRHCDQVFPDYGARFAFPGKLGDIRLFEKERMPHPYTRCYDHLADLTEAEYRAWADKLNRTPFVFKFAWGGERETVFLIRSAETFEAVLTRASQFERSGHVGFLLQEYVPHDRSLRIVIIGNRIVSYWRVSQSREDFGTSLGQGARLDAESDPDLQAAGASAVDAFSRSTGINLAAFDAIFSTRNEKQPLFLEINYFFGRRGLGGSEAYYGMLLAEIINWLAERGLCVGG